VTIAMPAATQSDRVMVFAVDDGYFCMHLNWIEAVYQREDAPLHVVNIATGTGRRFLIHRGEPALVIDLREAFDLADVLGSTERAALMVIRSGSFLLALQVDACMAVRNLDLRTAVPVPAKLVRDGGLSVGHLVEIDGKIHGLLEPNRILSGSLRERLEPMLKEVVAFRDRQNQIVALAAELRRDPKLPAIKTYARLSRRNGRARGATAARLVLKAAQETEQQADGTTDIAGDLAADTLLRDLVRLWAARQTGEVEVTLPAGQSGKIFLAAGRIADAFVPGEWGRGAFKRLLGAREGSYSFTASDTPVHPQRIADSALWLLIETVEQLNEERRGRNLH
jgi:chemotaxis signal transduction protein